MDIPVVSPEVTTPIAPSDEPEVSITDLPVEPTQPSPLLAITQGNCRLR